MAGDTLIVPIAQSGITTAVDQFLPYENQRSGRPVDSRGVFSAYPFMSPKYARHRSGRRHEFDQTMARMFLRIPPDLYDSFISSLEDADTQKIAKVLAGDDVKKGGHGYIDFLLQSATHELIEKVQISETLSDGYVAFFFGHAPPIFQYQGVLMNTYQDDWTMRMFRIFRDLGRGTQLARRNLTMRIRYDSMIVSGAMTSFRWALTAGQETYCPFSFSFLVKSIQGIYGNVAPPTQFANEEAFTPEGVQLEGTGVGDTEASMTYLESPLATPEGSTSETLISYNLDSGISIDVTGTPYTPPDILASGF